MRAWPCWTFQTWYKVDCLEYLVLIIQNEWMNKYLDLCQYQIIINILIDLLNTFIYTYNEFIFDLFTTIILQKKKRQFTTDIWILIVILDYLHICMHYIGKLFQYTCNLQFSCDHWQVFIQSGSQVLHKLVYIYSSSMFLIKSQNNINPI